MKRFIAAFFAVGIAVFAHSQIHATDNISDRRTDIWTLQFKGSTNTAVAVSSVGRMNMPDGIVNVHEHWLDTPTASTSAYKANGFTISTATLRASGTTFVTVDLTQGDYPRNLVVVSTFTMGSSTKTVVATATVVGIDSTGKRVSEVITFSTNTGTGNIAWSSISSITVVCTSLSGGSDDTNIVLHFGTGVKIGLANAITASNNLYKVLEAGADVVTTSVTVDTTYNTITFSNAPNGSRDYAIWYRATQSSPPRPR